jgi:hypothetical protein
MTTPPLPPLPPVLTSAVVQLCGPKRRDGFRAVLLRCTSCGWFGTDPGDGHTPDLFAPQHDDDICARRQTDPAFRAEQEALRTMGEP